MKSIFDHIIDKHKFILIFLLIVSLPFGYFYTQQRFLNNLDIFFVSDDPQLEAYKTFRQNYGNDEIAIIMASSENVFTNESIRIIRGISTMLNNMKGVQRVFSITEEEDPVGVNDTIAFQKIIPEGKMDLEALTDLRKKILDDDLLVKNFISDDGKTAIIPVEIDSFEGDESRHQVLFDIKKKALEIAGSHMRIRFSGSYIDDEMYTFSKRDYRIFTPITIIIIFLITAFLLRNISLSILSLVNVGMIIIWSMGVYTLCGETINMVTSIIAPILLAVSIADSIHILFHYRDSIVAKRMSHDSAVRNTIESIWLPCFFTSITTAIGFFSFVVSTVRPPRTVGIYTAAGVIIAFFLSLTWLPALLVFFRKRLEKSFSGSIKKKTFIPVEEDKREELQNELKINFDFKYVDFLQENYGF